MFLIDGRRVYVRNGPTSQTINICSDRNEEGSYDFVIRCKPTRAFSDETLQQHGFSTIQELVTFLQNCSRCDVEREPNARRQQVSEVPAAPETSRWDGLAISIVSKAIDQLVLDFIEFPYLHRGEHSIHCELFRILKSHTVFATTYPMGQRQTQCVHKEWPRRGTSAGGHIDLCILSPDDLKSCSYRDFQFGHLRPAIGIEMGLDNDLGHLLDDETKLLASESRTCFLVHLVREGVIDNFEAIERLLFQTSCRTAYARITSERAFVKLVDDVEVRTTG